MTASAISAATLTVPQLTDEVPIARSADTTARKATNATLGAVQSVTTTISATAMTTLHSSQIEVVPAQGTGTVIFVLGATMQYVSGTDTLGYDAYNANPPTLIYNAPSSGLIGQFTSVNDPSYLSLLNPLSNQLTPTSDAVNLGILLMTTNDYGVVGPLVSSSITPGQNGSGYAVNDTGVFEFGDPSFYPNYTVTSVDGGGGVTGYTLDSNGRSGNSASWPTAIGGAQPGAGDGSLEISAVVTGPVNTGSAVVTVFFTVAPQAS
jgi:hypothetical protein